MIDWGQWHNEPIAADLIILAGWFYAILAGPLRDRLAPGERWPAGRVLRFLSGLVLLYVAVASPLDRIGGLYLFSAHVGLQLVILYPAAALVLSGIPPWMIDPWVARSPFRLACLRLAVHPVVAGAVFVATTTVWYVPRLFEGALQSEALHGLEHGLFLAAAVLFWWPLISPSRALPPIGFGSRLIYLFCLEVALTAVFSYILMADHPMYPTYVLAPRIWPDH